MSRIDEALRRRDPHVQPSAGRAGQAMFEPAWPVAGEHRSEKGDRAELGVAHVGHSSAVRFSAKWGARLVNSPESDPALVEQFRRLAGTLHKARRLNGLRSVMVTSATSGDGKTLTAVNLALVLSGSFNSEVLLIDADLRRPSIPGLADFGQDAGLGEALTAKTEQKLALIRIAPRLTLIPAGQPMSNSIGAVTSPRMQHIIDEAIERYDWVILDAPPVGLTTDARLLSEFVGGTLFVVRAGQTQHRLVSEAIAGLGREQILGVVLNGVDKSGDEAGYYYDPQIQANRP